MLRPTSTVTQFWQAWCNCCVCHAAHLAKGALANQIKHHVVLQTVGLHGLPLFKLQLRPYLAVGLALSWVHHRLSHNNSTKALLCANTDCDTDLEAVMLKLYQQGIIDALLCCTELG
jgi:hypothetical protein